MWQHYLTISQFNVTTYVNKLYEGFHISMVLTFIRNIHYKICSKLTMKTLERCHWRRSSVFIVKIDQVNISWSSKCFLIISTPLCLQIIITGTNVLNKTWISHFIWTWKTSTLLYLFTSRSSLSFKRFPNIPKKTTVMKPLS